MPIDYTDVRFTGTPIFHHNGSISRSRNDGDVQYAGHPNSKIEEAWDLLLEGACASPDHYQHQSRKLIVLQIDFFT